MEMHRLERDDVKDLLPDYVLGTLSAADRQAVEAAVRGDAELERDLAAVRAARASLRHAPVALDAGRIADAVVKAAPQPARRARLATWRVAAAIATLAVGGGSLAVLQRTIAGERGGSLAVVGESLVVAAVDAPAITLGYGLSELSEEELEQVFAELEKFDGLPAAEPQGRGTIVPVGGDWE